MLSTSIFLPIPRTNRLLMTKLRPVPPNRRVVDESTCEKLEYSDKPCSQSPSTVTPMWGAAPVSSNPIPNLGAITKACEAWIKAAANWKDEDSLQIAPLVDTGMTTIGESAEARAVYAFHTSINGKNSYGGYTGPKSAICYLLSE